MHTRNVNTFPRDTGSKGVWPDPFSLFALEGAGPRDYILMYCHVCLLEKQGLEPLEPIRYSS